MNLDDGNICDECSDSFFFEDGECKKCIYRFEYCNNCNADECTECIDNFSLKDDGLCWESHCAEYLDEFRDYCISCEYDEETGIQWLLDGITGVCVEACDDMTQKTDLNSNICRNLCEADEYYDFEDPTNCIPCAEYDADGADFTYCTACWEVDDIIRPYNETLLYCDDCGEILRPTDDQQSCEHTYCVSISPLDELECLLCENNYYRALDTTRCWEECPLNYGYEIFERDNYTRRACDMPCAADEFRDFGTKLCYPCNDYIDGCTSCEFDLEKFAPVCLNC